jgi:tetratricopeptide (TPR) repeat protein
MLCCLNPDCDRPINPDDHVHCQNCGVPLIHLLHSRFKVIEPIGRGGFGKTYLAEDTHKLSDRCVVKQLAYQGEGTRTVQQKVVQLFEQEAKQLQQLGENPQIPTLLAYFEEDGYLYLVQQFVEGNNLLKQLETHGKYGEEKIRQLLLDILPILEYVHNQGTIHRDIKPENIMLRRKDNKAVLIDFGVSKLMSQTVVTGASIGTSLGSHGYSPPEQIKEGRAVYASDLFALGATCFHLMSGIHPFHLWADYGYSWVTDWRKYILHPISIQLGAVLDKLLQKELQNRYQSAHEVLQDLQSISPVPPIVAPTVPFSSPPVVPPQAFVGSDPAPPSSRKGWTGKLALVFGVGIISVAVTVSLKVNEPKVGSISPEASPASQPQPIAGAPPINSPPSQLTAEQAFNLGIEKEKTGDKQGAIADYTKAIELDPKFALAYNNRGFVRSALGDKQGAIADYTESIRFNNPELHIPYNNRGIAHADLGNTQAAIADYNKALEINPKYALAYNNRGSIRSNLGDKRAAIADYNKAIELDPKYTIAYNNRGSVYDDLGDRQAAIADYNKAIEIDPDYVDAYNNRGNARFGLGDKKGAITDYNKALALNPKYAITYYNRGNARFDLEDKQAAIADYNKAIEFNPKYVEAYNNRGNARFDLGDKKGSIDDYSKVIELNPNYVLAFTNRGNARADLGDKKGSIDDYQKASELYQKAGQTEKQQHALDKIKQLQQ